MKKTRILQLTALALTLVMVFALFAACKKETPETGENPVESSETPTAEAPKLVERSDYKVDKYVKLGEYKGLELTRTVAEVTDDEVQQSVDSLLQSLASENQIKDRAVAIGDTINLDYSGKKDGVVFDGGTAQGQTLAIGSGQFIAGFEDGLVGVMPGEKVSLDLTFPAEYQNAELAGAAVVFEVTVNYIAEQVMPEYTDELVAGNTDYATKAEYEASIRADLVKSREQAADEQLNADLWAKIAENSKITAYPKEDYDDYIASAQSYYDQICTANGITFEQFLEYNGMTQDGYDSFMVEQAQTYLSSYVVLVEAIAKKEGIEATQEDFDAYVAKQLELSGFASEEEFKAVYGQTVVEAMTEARVWTFALQEKVTKALLATAKIS